MESRVTLPSDSAIRNSCALKWTPRFPGSRALHPHTRRCHPIAAYAPARCPPGRPPDISPRMLCFSMGSLMGKSDFDSLVTGYAASSRRCPGRFPLLRHWRSKRSRLCSRKRPDNAAHRDAIADAAHSRPQSTDPTHDEVDLHSRLRRAIQFANDVAIEQRIHLGDDACRTPVPRVIGLAGNQVDAALRQVDGRNQQRIVIRPLRIGRQKVEDAVHRQK